jgi:hypothetical protein
MTDITSFPGRKGKGKGTKRKRATRNIVLDSDDVILSETESEKDDEDEDMGDFIVQSDDEGDKDIRRNLKKRLGKRRAIAVDSDDEIEDSPEDKEVLFGAKKAPAPGEAIKLMPRFLPSTKMKVRQEEEICYSY